MGRHLKMKKLPRIFCLFFLLHVCLTTVVGQINVQLFSPNPDEVKGLFICENSQVELVVKVFGVDTARLEDFSILIDGQRERSGKAEVGTLSRTTFKKTVIVPTGSHKIEVIYDGSTGIGRTKPFGVANYGKPNLHLLVFGTSPRDLKFTAKDAIDIADLFKSQEDKIYGKIDIVKLTGEKANTTNMNREIERCATKFKLGDIRPADVVVLFISSHGFLDAGMLYLHGDDYDAGAPTSTSVSYSFILEKLKSVKCKKLILIDACHSGGGRQGFKDINEAIDSLSKLQDGIVTFASSSADQTSHEDSTWQNGAFTEALLSGLAGAADVNKDHFITLNEIWNYVKPEVQRLVLAVNRGIQIPQRPRSELSDIPFFALPEFLPPPDKAKLDADKDGTPDILDDCPTVFGLISANGCPDRDKDGVPDHIDRCPEKPGIAFNKGCPELPDDFVSFADGTFSLGSDEGEENESPAHTVKLDGFYLSPTEVSIADFRQFVLEKKYKTTAETTGWGFIFNGRWQKAAGANWQCDGQGNRVKLHQENLPVVFVSWLDALEYCNWLSIKKGLTPCYTISSDKISCNWSADGYRLPTEAEWEFAARSGGQKTAFAGTSKIEELSKVANFCEKDCPFQNGLQTQSDGFSMAAPVKSLRPTPEGIYNLSGNVWEWCWDVYQENYPKEFQTNPGTQQPGDLQSPRTIRGGAWSVAPGSCRTTARNSELPEKGVFNIGFRVCRSQ